MDQESFTFLNRKYIESMLLKIVNATREVLHSLNTILDNLDIAQFSKDEDAKKHLNTFVDDRLIEVTIKINMKEFVALKDSIILRVESDFNFFEDFVVNGVEEDEHDWSREVLRDMRRTRSLLNTIFGQAQEQLETQIKKVADIEGKKVNSNND